MSCLAQAIHRKCFSIPVFIKWSDRYGPPAPDPNVHAYTDHPEHLNDEDWKSPGSVLVPKRWLQPENVDLLIPLWRDLKIAFPFDVPDNRLARFIDAVSLASNPDVPFLWMIEIRQQCRNSYILDSERPRFLSISNLPRVLHTLLIYALERPNITKDELEFLAPPNIAIHGPLEVASRAFGSKNEEVIRWAISRGWAPTIKQLTGYTINDEANVLLDWNLTEHSRNTAGIDKIPQLVAIRLWRKIL